MLEWLSGASLADDDAIRDGKVVDEETELELPDTPAPIFAVRAFKQALFGTPAPPERSYADRKVQRISTRVSTSGSKDDTKAPTRTNSNIDRATVSSPAKPTGILLTPGTGGARRKTVSFGNHFVESAGCRAQDNKGCVTPRDVPGRYPSPWVSMEGAVEEQSRRTRLTRSLFDVRESNKSTNGQPVTEDITRDLEIPKSSSGRYWKEEYDSYASKSNLEMRKLAKKEQLAKKYAKHKDTEAIKLRDQLRQEQRKVDKLEKELGEYMARLEAAMGGLAVVSNKAQAKTRPSAYNEQPLVLQDALRETKSALSSLEKENEKLSISNASLEASLKESEAISKASDDKILFLQRENDMLKRGLAGQKQSPRESHAEIVLSSDIWADLAVEDCLKGVSLKDATPPKFRKRPPLSHREANQKPGTNSLGMPTWYPKKSTEGTTVSVNQTEERRERLEAAKRRLDMKKRSRAQNNLD